MGAPDGELRGLPRIAVPSRLPLVVAAAVKTGGSGNASVDIPSKVAPGDVMVVYVGSNYDVASTPSGWTGLENSTGSYYNSYMMRKVAEAGDAGSTVTISMAGSEPWGTNIVVLRPRGDFTELFDVVRGQSGTSITTDSKLPTAESLLLAFGGFRASSGAITLSPAGRLAADGYASNVRARSEWSYVKPISAAVTATNSASATGRGAGLYLMTPA